MSSVDGGGGGTESKNQTKTLQKYCLDGVLAGLIEPQRERVRGGASDAALNVVKSTESIATRRPNTKRKEMAINT